MSKGKVSLGVMMALVASLLLPVIAANVAVADEPIHVTFDNRGCSLPATYTPTPVPLCANADYDNGNLGKGWNELDLVPFRLFAVSGNQNSVPNPQTYTGAIVVDNMDAGAPGYDALSGLTKNTALSTGTSSNCAVSDTGTQTTTGFGGADQSLYRLVTITQEKNTTCVFDYFARLAVGAHTYPGSSLHTNLASENLTSAGGGQELSIPVKEILPQSITKTVTAVQDSDFAWTIDKGVEPASWSFGNVCDTTNLDTEIPLDVTITWEKVAGAPQAIMIHTLIEATNPAARVITVQVTDQLYSGAGTGNPIGAPVVGVAHDLAANSANNNVLEYDTTVPAGTADLHDIASGTYTDKLTGVPVPGQAIAGFPPFIDDDNDPTTPPVDPGTFYEVGEGDVTNDTAIVSDSETISGAGLSFTLDSVTGDADAIAGQSITGSSPGPVEWTSGTVSGGGEVVLHKTITLDASAGATSGSLDDTATINGSDGATDSSQASVALDSTLQGSLVINKETSIPVDPGTTFEFTVNPGGIIVPVVIGADGLTGSSDPVNGLDAGDYTITETNTNGFPPADDQNFTIGPGEACSVERDFVNTAGPASATATKITNPLGAEAGWEFTVTGPNGFSDTGTSDSAGDVQWDTAGSDTLILVDEGTYTITETTQAGWVLDPITVNDNGNGTGTTDLTSCSFTVDLPADTDGAFSCSFTNTELGSITIVKATDPSPDPLDSSFEFTRDFGTSPLSLKDGGTDTVSDLAPGPYSAAETDPSPNYALTSFVCDNGDDASAITLGAGEDIICTATNTLQNGNIVVQKVTDPASDTTTEFEFNPSYDDNFKLVGGGEDNSGPLTPGGGYSVEEINLPAGWSLKSFTCDGVGNTPAAITVVANETVTCIATNEQAGTISVKKLFNGAPDATKSFTFELRQGVDINDPLNPLDDNAGTPLDSKVISANGNAVQLNSYLAPGVYQVCEVVPGPGWTFNLGGGEYTLVINGSNDRVCVDVDVSAGENVTVNADNSPPPGGGQLTIGFWKNHASCKTSSGKQSPVLDDVLKTFPIEAGQTKPGFYVGDLYVDTCSEAVALLNKTAVGTVGKGKKLASDALFNLASQFVAAKLNVQGGAGTCGGTAITLLNQAQTLLAVLDFNGVTSLVPTAQQKADALYLAGQLDLYNNGNLC